MFKVSVDLGYGYTKGVNSNNLQVMFPSIISMDIVNSSDIMEDVIPKEKSDNSIKEMLENLSVSISNGKASQSFKVGEAAKFQSDASYLLDSNKINNIETKVLLAASSVLLFPDENVPVHLITGLPISEYKHQKDELNEMLLKYKFNVSLPKYNTTKVIKFAKVDIFPQGVGAVFNSVWNDIAKYTIPNTYIGFIDWGYKTIDYVVFNINQSGIPKAKSEYSGTLNNGMYQIGNDINEVFKEKTGSLLEIGDLSQLVADGSTWYNGETVDVKNELLEIKRERARKASTVIRSRWADIMPKMSTVFIGGGGGVDMYEYLKDFTKNTELVKDAQMGNALGSKKIADMKEKITDKA